MGRGNFLQGQEEKVSTAHRARSAQFVSLPCWRLSRCAAPWLTPGSFFFTLPQDVRRVFDHLAGFARRTALGKTLAEKQTRLSELPRDQDTDKERGELESEVADIKMDLKNRQDDVKKVITNRDLDQALRALNRVCNKKQLEASHRAFFLRVVALALSAHVRTLARARARSVRARYSADRTPLVWHDC